MSMYQYQDVIDACLLAAQKLYKARNPYCRLPWRVSIDGNTAGILKGHRDISLCLPFLPLDARLTRDERDIWIAYVIHEVGHALFTDFDAWHNAIRGGIQDIANGLEDPRIEGALIAQGVATNARAMLEKLTEQKLQEAITNNAYDPADLSNLAYTLAVYGRIKTLGFDLPSAPALPANIDSALAWVWPRLKACAGTPDIVVLAHEVKAWRDAQQTQQQQTQQTQDAQDAQDAPQEAQDSADEQEAGQQQDAKQDAPSDAQGEQETQSQDSDGASDTQGGKDQDAPQTSNGEGGNKLDGAGLRKGDTIPVEPELNKQADEILKRMKARDVVTEYADKQFARVPRITPKPTEKTRRHTAVEVLDKVFPSTAKLKADLTRLVKSPALVSTQRGLAAGRLDRHAFARIAGGRTNVFAHRQFTEGVNSAVAIVLDGSRSMRGRNEKYAAAMALAIGDALDRAAVPFEVSRTGEHPQSCIPQIDIMKTYAASWRKTRELLANSTPYEGTCNLTGAASAVGRLKQVRGVTRRLLFVLSDGQDSYTSDAWKRAQQLWARDGVETIGVGLEYDVSRIFPDFVNVFDPDQLAREGLGALTRKLNKNAA